jgi:hypothetical protein
MPSWTTKIRAHLDLLGADLVRRGMTRAQARAAVRRECGGVDEIKEQYHDQQGWRWIDSLAQDGRQGPVAFGRTLT